MDKNKTGWLNQAGLLEGIKNVTPPVRLAFTPYVASYFTKEKVTFKGGLDLKYGLNESFTLDMCLFD